MRLQATELESRDAGFDARETGNLLHRTLQKFWSHTPSQAALNAMSPEDRRTLLTRCIDESIDYRLIIDSAWDNAYLQIQKQRLLNLLTHWLDEELRRGPFTILHLEHEQPLNVGPLHLTLRVDRLDAVADGVFLVDYKTGYAAKQDNWLGERPDEPQLPLYALLPEAEHLKGLAFAKVRAGKDMKWLGFQSELGLIPSKKTEDLSTQIAEWRNILTALAEDFAAGNASVNPKDYPNTCTHCTQRLLCRLDPITFLATEPDDDTHNTEEDDINV
jgi:ATP-dependent helicase/DNAse subunit B